MKRFLLCLSVVLAVFSLSSEAFSAEEMRKWTNSEGQSFEGRLQGFENNIAEIMAFNGRIYKVPAHVLSEDDQEYLKGYAERRAKELEEQRKREEFEKNSRVKLKGEVYLDYPFGSVLRKLSVELDGRQQKLEDEEIMVFVDGLTNLEDGRETELIELFPTGVQRKLGGKKFWIFAQSQPKAEEIATKNKKTFEDAMFNMRYRYFGIGEDLSKTEEDAEKKEGEEEKDAEGSKEKGDENKAEESGEAKESAES